jgi:hypothetical protein
MGKEHQTWERMKEEHHMEKEHHIIHMEEHHMDTHTSMEEGMHK